MPEIWVTFSFFLGYLHIGNHRAFCPLNGKIHFFLNSFPESSVANAIRRNKTARVPQGSQAEIIICLITRGIEVQFSAPFIHYKVMRKILFTLIVLGIFNPESFAQLKVSNTGKVGVNIGTSTPLSNLSINSVGDTNSALYAVGATNGIWSERSGTTGSAWVHSVVGNAPVVSGRYNAGLRGQSYLTSPLGGGRAFGVFGIGGNSSNGYNYGLFGTTYGSQNGAGVVGTINNNQDVNVPGLFAGYFVGNVKVTGLINGVTVGDSDERLKKNIAELGTAIPASKGVNVLNTVLQMTPVEYNLKQQYIESIGDSAVVKQARYDEKSQMFQKKHYGLIAQELQLLYPDLVYESDDGHLSINYTGIIPLLVQSIKELKAEVDELKSSDTSVKKATLQPTSLTPVGTGAAVLYQNAPNPFSVQTSIRFEIPQTVQHALLYIFNMNGTLLKSIQIYQRGEGNEILNANEFKAGMYLYSLVTDGRIVDTKQMMFTE